MLAFDQGKQCGANRGERGSAYVAFPPPRRPETICGSRRMTPDVKRGGRGYLRGKVRDCGWPGGVEFWRCGSIVVVAYAGFEGAFERAGGGAGV